MENTEKTAILYKIEKLIPTLSKTERRVADYVIQNPETVIELSVAALAETTGVSDATVVRTCRSLGFSGYQNFKIALAQDIVKPQQFVHEDILYDDNVQDIMLKVFGGTIQTLKFTYSTLSWEDVAAAAKAIISAKAVHVFGVGASGAIAIDLHHKLLRLGICADVYTDAHLQAICAAYAKKRDVIFAISHSGSSKSVVDNAQHAKENGATILTLTSMGSSPLTKLADVSLFTASEETKYRIVSISSRLAGLTIIDTIYTYIALQKEDIKNMKVEKAMEKLKY